MTNDQKAVCDAMLDRVRDALKRADPCLGPVRASALLFGFAARAVVAAGGPTLLRASYDACMEEYARDSRHLRN